MILKQFAVDIANSFTKWSLWRGGGGSSTLAELEDVTITTPQADEVLQFDGDKWINAIVESGASLGGKVEYITQIGVLPIPIQYSNYDIIIFIVPSTDNVQILGTMVSNSENLPKQLQIPITNNSRVVISNTNMITERPAYCGNVLVYGVKFAPIEPNLHEYSTQEKVIGTWIDSKPIYEKTIFTNNSNTDLSELNIETVIDYYFSNTNRWYAPSNYYGSSTDRYISYYDKDSKNIVISSGWGFINTYITIQYTKTTE